MKRKTFLSLVLSMIMILSFSITGMTAGTVGSDNTPYTFPVVPGTSEWESFQTKQEMLNVSQIPEDKLKNMTTAALIETVMNYPMINSYYAFNTIEDACEVMSNDFNGFNELFLRNDVTPALLEKYSVTNVLTANETKTATPNKFFAPATVEYLIACDEIKNGKMEGSDLAKFNGLHAMKSAARDEAGIYSEQSEVFSMYKEDTVLTRAAGDTWTAVSAGTVKTPKGNNVPQIYKRSPEFTASEKALVNADIQSVFPGATRTAEPTVKYNCHSYAWYQQSTSNPYWIGKTSAPSIYTTDGSYSRYSGTPRSGMKAWYNGGEHSGVSIGARVEYGSQVHYVRSKWGMAGIYEHPFSYSPYTPSVAFYTAN